jgi:glucose uptake protein
VETFLLATITVLAWGTWLAPSEKVVLPNPQTRGFYVALGNLVLAAIALFVTGPGRLTADLFLYPFIGGVIWSIAGWMAFTATSRIGMAKAMGTWAPLNIVVGILWGMVLFGEFLQEGPNTLLFAGSAVAATVTGILFIIFSGQDNHPTRDGNGRLAGFAGAFGAGLLWGTYFVPTAWLARTVDGVDDWVVAFPLAVGMFAGSLILVLLGQKAPRCATHKDTFRVLTSGLLWTIGNFSMLFLVGRIGIGKGFTIAQMCVVMNALVGILVFRDPPPRSRAARFTLAGVVLATLGAVVLGNLRY